MQQLVRMLLRFAEVSTLAVVILIGLCIVPSWPGDLIERKRVQSPAFDLEVSSYKERPLMPPFLPGAIHVLRARPVGRAEWSELVRLRHDDALPVSPELLSVRPGVGQAASFLFFGRYLGTTLDGGGTWTLWNLRVSSR